MVAKTSNLKSYYFSLGNLLYISVGVSAALKPALVTASRCGCKAARSTISIHRPSLIRIERG